jgi:methylmalonyl-CoA/ethylmalonyl-CoA epimerase
LDSFRFHHAGVAVRNLQDALPDFTALFGYQTISGPFDDPVQNVSVCFLSRGPSDPVIELVAPLGPNSPVDRLLKKGGGVYHLCYEVPDLDLAIHHLADHGAYLLHEPAPAVAFGMRRIAWLMTQQNLLVELLASSLQPDMPSAA